MKRGKKWAHSCVHSDMPFHSHTYIFYGCMFSWCYCGKRNSFHHRKGPLTPVKILCLSPAIVDWRHKKNMLYNPSSDKKKKEKKMEIHFGKIQKELSSDFMVQNRVAFGCRFEDPKRKTSAEKTRSQMQGYVKTNCIQQEADWENKLPGLLSWIHTRLALYLLAIGHPSHTPPALHLKPKPSQNTSSPRWKPTSGSLIPVQQREREGCWAVGLRGAIYHHPSRGRRPDFYCLCHTLTSRVYGGSDGGSHHLEIRGRRRACTVCSVRT